MRKFKIKIESENHYECHRSLRIDNKIFTAIIIAYILLVVAMELVVVLIEAQYNFSEIKESKMITLAINTCIIIRTIAKAIIESFMFVNFVKLFNFFVRTKVSRQIMLSRKNYFVIYHTIFLSLLHVFYKLISTFYWSYSKSTISKEDSEIEKKIYIIVFLIYQQTYNLILGSSFLALFYHMGNLKRGNLNQKTTISGLDDIESEDFDS